MKLNSRATIFLLAFCFVSSCRTAPEEPILSDKNNNNENSSSTKSNNIVPVTINFLGVEREIKTTNSSQHAKYKASLANQSINNGYSVYTQVLDDGSGAVEVEQTTPSHHENEYFASSINYNKENENILPNGVRYKILAYEKNGDNYIFDKQKTFAIGAKNPQIHLRADKKYMLLVASTGTVAVPSVIGEDDFRGVRFVLNQVSPDAKLLYQRIDNYIPNGNIDENSVDIKLKNKTTSVKITLDASDIMGGGFPDSGRILTHVSDAKIAYTRPKQVEFRLYDQAKMYSSETYEAVANIGTLGKVNKMKIESDLINNIVIGKNSTPKFSVKYKAEHHPKEQSIELSLKGFMQDVSQGYTIKLRDCGAYLGPNKTNWRWFMCHNLGADYSRNPFIPSDKIHGDKYQWGREDPAIKQKDDKYEYPRKQDWNRTSAYNTWNRGLKDPCPEGWRIPTSGEWSSALNNNSGIKLGNWKANTLKVNDAGVGIGGRLMLPAAGKRFEYGETIVSKHIDFWHATMVTVWTSTESSDRAFAVVVFKNKDQREQYEVTRDFKKLDGIPIRCIKKD